MSVPTAVSAGDAADCLSQTGSPCQACGACCAYSHDWPRFSTESDSELALIPDTLVSASLSHMRCDGERCLALAGTIGQATRCTIYAARPVVCRSCQPGDPECLTARAHFGMSVLDATDFPRQADK